MHDAARSTAAQRIPHAAPGLSSTTAAPVTPIPAPAPKAAPRSVVGDFWPVLVLLAAPIALTIWGRAYYFADLGVRLRHPYHALLRPTGALGLSLGVAGFLLFGFMWLYVARKSVKWLAWTGPVGSWLRIHAIVGLVLPILVAVHAGWRFDGLIGLGYFAMAIVSLSGIIGRYLYAHIPRQRNGLEMSREEVTGERRALLTRIAATTGLEPKAVERALAVDTQPYAHLDPIRTLIRLAHDDWQRHQLMRRLRREWLRRADGTTLDRRELDETLRLARREMSLSQQVRALDAARRVFGLWHVAHRPFAMTALLAVLIHVIVAVVVGGIGFGGGFGR